MFFLSPIFFVTKFSPMFSPCFFHLFLQSFHPCFFFHHNIFNFCQSFYHNIFSFCLSFYKLSVFTYKVFTTTFSVLTKFLTPHLTFLLVIEPTTQCSSDICILILSMRRFIGSMFNESR